jgi:molybdopterin molybdotransferase
MTGAPVPPLATAVVPVEETNFASRGAGVELPESVLIFKDAFAGQNVRPAGMDVHSDDLILQAGSRIRPQDAGFLSMLGIPQAPVRRRPRVAVFSTGDELVPVELPLSPGKIHDANGYTLASLVEQSGAEALNLGVAADRPEDIQAILNHAVDLGVDIILSSAGVSVGAFDFVRTVVESAGKLDFWRVNMRPGKPLAFGEFRGIPFVGLPGNPVSAYVGFEVFVRAALLKMLGLKTLLRPVWRVRLMEPLESDGRESYLRAVVSWQGGELAARLTGHQGSGNLLSLVQANALLLIPSGVKSVPSGAQVDAWMLDDAW